MPCYFTCCSHLYAASINPEQYTYRCPQCLRECPNPAIINIKTYNILFHSFLHNCPQPHPVPFIIKLKKNQAYEIAVAFVEDDNNIDNELETVHELMDFIDDVFYDIDN